MSIQINNGFNLKASIPLDSRFVFQDMADLNAMPVHELYIGLLTYVIEKQAFYVYNGATFEEFKSKSDYFLDPVETASNLSSIQSPKKGAVCLVKDEKRFYTYVGDTTVTGTITTGPVTTVTNDTSIPMTVSLIFADNPEVSDEFPASIDLSNAAQVIDNYVDGWAPVTCKAIEIAYDNTTSNLKADNIQAAIDELVSLIEETPSPIPPISTPGDLPDPSDSKPGDIVVVKNPKTIYVFDGDTWIEINARSEYYLDPVETKANLQLDPLPSYGTVCMVKNERAFYVYVNATSAELNGQPAQDAWICTKTKAEDIPFDNTDTGLTGTTVNEVINEINTTVIERTILDWPDDPTTVEVGGIEAGYQTPADGINVDEFLYMMTHPFVYPTISMQLETADGVFEKNTSKTLSKIVLTSTDGTKVAFEENNPSIFVAGVQLTDPTDKVTISVDKKTYTRELASPIVMNGTVDKKVVAKVELNGKEISTEKSYEFIYPFYAASLTGNIVSEYNNTLFVDSNKILTKKSNQVVSYTHANKVMAFAYPSEYGALSKIVDQNGFDITGTFSATTFMYGSVSFRVYCTTTPNTLSGFNVTFKF